jgi:plasmid replication initiation protein
MLNNIAIALMTVTERVDAESQALVYSQQVTAGAKLAATLQVKCEMTSDVQAVCEREGCQVVVDMRDGWAYIWIYKYPFVRLLIDAVRKRGAPKSALDTWINGKLFGYSDYEIARALEKEGYIESAIT